jgi:hypothetical protein
LRALVDIPLTSKEVAVDVRDALAVFVRLARHCLDAVRRCTRFGIGRLGHQPIG